MYLATYSIDKNCIYLLLRSFNKMISWTDSLEIAISLEEAHPNIDPLTINFVKLRELVMALEDFNEGNTNCGEKVLEAIQMCWIDEK